MTVTIAKRLTFVVPESSRSYSFIQQPWGMLKTAAVMEKIFGCSVSVIDNRVERLPLERLVERVHATNPDILMCTTNTYDQSQVYILGPRLHRLFDTARALSKLRYPYIVCGPHLGANTELFCRDIEFDFGLKGQFDMTLPAVYEDILEKISYQKSTLNEGKRKRLQIIYDQPKEQDEALEMIVPDYSKVPMERYFGDLIRKNVAARKAGWGIVLAARGCPYSCDFCHLFLGRGFKPRPIEAILAEIRVLYEQYDVRGIWFMDYTFTANKKWVIDLCKGIRDLGYKDFSFSCQTRPDRIDTEIARYLALAGCSDVWLGIESFGTATLQAVNKNIPVDITKEAIQIIRGHGMQPVSYIMLGLPGETPETLRETLSIFSSLELSYLDGIELATPRPGTPLFENYKEEYPRLKTSWGYLDAVAGLLGNEATPGMLMEAMLWLAKRNSIYEKKPLPSFIPSAKEIEIKNRILELGKVTV